MFTGLRMGRIGVALGLAVLIGIAMFGRGSSLGPEPASAGGGATIVVDTLADPGAPGECALRDAMTNADNNDQSGSTDCAAGTGDDTITFSVSGEIILSIDLPPVTSDEGLTIDGGGAITVSGNGAYQPFMVDAGFGFHGVLTLQGLTVTDGYSDQDGGGIYARGDLTLINTAVTGNTADRHGGGIFLSGIAGSNLTLIDSSLSGNTAGSTGQGGGLYFSPGPGGEAVITRSTVSGNVSGNGGGGIAAFSGTLTVANSTLSGNNGAGFGGGISTNTTTVLINNTITDNSASVSGGGIRVGPAGDVTLTNTIVADQQSGGDCGVSEVGDWTSGGHNLDTDGTCELGAAGDIPNGNANLGPLADNGGPTLTHPLLGGSQAIDAGDNAVCAAEPVDGVDQRGVERPQGAACDIGAFEATPLWGDVDCDGGVAIGDALKIARHLLGLSVGQEPGCPAIGSDVTVDGEERTWGDADCDGGVAIGDALKTARWLLGLSVSQEPGCPEIGDSIGLG